MNYNMNRNVRIHILELHTQGRYKSACVFAHSKQSSLATFWIVQDANILHADNKD